MKYIVLNDPHTDVKAPSFRRRDDYLAVCESKLTAVADLCRAHDVEALCCTGDWFHKKHPQAVPHRLVRMVLEWTHYVTDVVGIPILTIIGNHDVQFNDTSPQALQGQPVGVLLTNPKVHLLDHNPYRLSDAVVCGSSYRKSIVVDGEVREDPEQFHVLRPTTSWLVHLTHASVVPEPVMWHPHTPFQDVAHFAVGTDIMHTGHIHEDLGIHGVHIGGRGMFWWTNTGSMTRGSLTEETIAREPNVLLVELPTGGPSAGDPRFTRLVLPHAPAEQIYDVSAYREAKVQTKEFSAWTDQLRREVNAAETTAEKSLEDIVEESALDSAARDLALRLLNQAGA